MVSSTETYRKFAAFYDRYTGRFDADLPFYKSFCQPGDKIIETGCGTGRVLNVLVQSGNEVTGVDISEEMLKKAGEKLKPWIDSSRLRLLNHDFSVSPIKESFNKAFITFYTFNYILDHPSVFLKNMTQDLVPGGILVMDLFYPVPLYDKTIAGKWVEKEYLMDGDEIKVRDNRSMNGNMELRKQVFIVNGEETNIDTFRRYFSPSEIKSLLEPAGLRRIEFSVKYDITAFRDSIDENELKTNYLVKAVKD